MSKEEKIPIEILCGCPGCTKNGEAQVIKRRKVTISELAMLRRPENIGSYMFIRIPSN